MKKHVLQNASKIKAIGNLLICFVLCFFHANVFAETKPSKQIFDGISKQFSSSSAKEQQVGELFLLLIAGTVLIFVIWLAYQFFGRGEKNSTSDDASNVYKKLCKAHNLSVTEKHVIRKVFRHIGLDDPLPLFVEPEHFRKVLEDESMGSCHSTVRDILKKLFESEQVLPLDSEQEKLTDAIAEPQIETAEFSAGERDVTNESYHEAHSPDDPSAHNHFEQEIVPESIVEYKETSPSSSNGANVLLNTIPGRRAFSALVEPFQEVSSEIAAASIRHTLSEGGEMNQRTFDAVGESRNVRPEPASPLFPKSNVPSPREMLVSESHRSDSPSPASPTPRFLRHQTRKMSATGFSETYQNRAYENSFAEPKTQEIVALMETIVMEK